MAQYESLVFDVALSVGMPIEARWTNSGHGYVAPAMVTKVNSKSVLVALTENVTHALGEKQPRADMNSVMYLAGSTIRLPRALATDYSPSNGAYPIPVTDVVSMRQVPAGAFPGEYAPQALVLGLVDTAGALGDDEDAPVAPVPPMVWLYTNAPVTLDLPGTMSLEVVGTLVPKEEGVFLRTIFRKVLLPAYTEDVQASAYDRRGWAVHSPQQWVRRLNDAWFQQRFVPRGCEATAPGNGFPGGDPAPAPCFDRDDAAWVEALETMLGCVDIVTMPLAL